MRRAPDFWGQPVGWRARVLTPASWFYRLGGWLRRLRARGYRSAVPVICVGNIMVGGSGKTPVALALAGLLREAGQRPVFVTRGYGGSEAGPLQVDPARHSAAEVGDEALLLAQAAPVWVGRDRVAAIRAAESEASHIILDDGLQNPHVLAHLNVLVIDAEAGFGNGRLLPAGPLREKLADALQRVGAVVVVGGDLAEGGAGGGLVLQADSFGSLPVFYARILPQLPGDFPVEQDFFAFAGIGRPEKFYATARAAGLRLVETVDFGDHHPFTSDELLELIEQAAAHNATLLTTEKDAMRLPPELRMQVETVPVKLAFDDIEAVKRLLQSLSTTAPLTPS